MIEIKNFSKIYQNEKKAVDNISLTVGDGEIFAFIGHNGAGKSTTIRSIMNLINKTSGKVLIENKEFNKNDVKIKEKSGIAKEDLPHIFERFYKGQNACNESCGIGLSLAKTIIEKSNGYINVESEVGKGSTFTIKYFRM